MTTKLEQAARQLVTNWDSGLTIHDELDALREALKPRPQNCGTGYCSCIECPYEAEQAEQGPVAWVEVERGIPMFMNFTEDYKPYINNGIAPLYAAPVRTKDLTDDEIADIRMSIVAYEPVEWGRVFARAVIAADREKNK